MGVISCPRRSLAGVRGECAPRTFTVRHTRRANSDPVDKPMVIHAPGRPPPGWAPSAQTRECLRGLWAPTPSRVPVTCRELTCFFYACSPPVLFRSATRRFVTMPTFDISHLHPHPYSPAFDTLTSLGASVHPHWQVCLKFAGVVVVFGLFFGVSKLFFVCCRLRVSPREC